MKRHSGAIPEIPITPMIDCVFLLLVYFMCTASMEAPEGRVPLPLPGQGGQNSHQAANGTELWVEFGADHQLFLEGNPCDHPQDLRYRELESALRDQEGSETLIWIQPLPETPHQVVVRALQAVALSGSGKAILVPLE